MNNENNIQHESQTETVRAGHVSFEVVFEVSQDDLSLRPLEQREIIEDLRNQLQDRLRKITSEYNHYSETAMLYDIESTVRVSDSMLYNTKEN